MRTPRSRIAAAITLLFVVGGVVVVVLAVVGVVRDPRDDAAWAAVVLGAAIAAWGVWFHGLGADDAATTDDAGTAAAGTAGTAGAPDVRPAGRPGAHVLGTAAVAGIVGAGGYWLLRGPLDRGVAEAAVVAAITLGLWLLGRSADAVSRRRRRQ
ncbi:hypothetical protein [Curtobacterium sp. L1-20]|uniref:hypothetical protein n=1 Tax=Curtobacterium sp. L1-20 TaxID=3138181 RepID=UPI003B51BEAD